MKSLLGQFLSDESGATTVDWVLLTAGVMSLTLAVMGTYGGGAKGLSETLSSTLASSPLVAKW